MRIYHNGRYKFCTPADAALKEIGLLNHNFAPQHTIKFTYGRVCASLQKAISCLPCSGGVSFGARHTFISEDSVVQSNMQIGISGGAYMDCIIREWKMEDKAPLAKILNNQKILNNLRDGLPYPYTEKDAEEFITSVLSADKSKTFAFAITVNDMVIGSIGVFRCDNIHFQTAEMGYYLGEPYWGKGFATSAVKQICRYIFDNTDIIRIFAEPFAYNVASCTVLEKAGFQLEGILHSNAVKNGKVLDMKMYAFIKKSET